ncbi:hypothetical protein, partial [Paraburkholderia sp. BR14374]|uniref:hypothetical protein n=1 Tax=Paraburkholderia sp. BR14374 TaxID=3237007 RepID=UPI0034CDD12B
MDEHVGSRRVTRMRCGSESSEARGIDRVNAKTPPLGGGVSGFGGSLTITYFHTGNPHYHRR